MALIARAASIAAIDYRSGTLDNVFPGPGVLAEGDAELVVVPIRPLGIGRLSAADSAIDLVHTQDLPCSSLAEAAGQLARQSRWRYASAGPSSRPGSLELWDSLLAASTA